ncbi:hypothetical protein PDESU_02744 [Pontiella desulfatans]|uniref:Pectate lyase superfamily protein domain-containing protein n=1 Tax=Pontiella desulfatans TaxID=2750659 RepID=A0A6C2U2W2_PONDE|nr:DUF4955 domain-containing protein [Pontiella desulfatans]VGO14185.1 hypothetical protein PDESU_02744 [Pontiella desulfatans]
MNYGFLALLVFGGVAHAATSEVWNDWDSGKPVIPDYSWAGYMYGAEAIPDVEWKVFDVARFGALPDDGKDDYAAIQRAIKAAEANGSGIVFFPPGKFLVAEREGIADPIEINGANIVLRGSGSGANGTEIHQKHHFLPEDPEKKWTVPPVFVFRHPTNEAHLSRYRDQQTKLAKVVKPAGAETFCITLDDASKIKPNQTVMLCAQSTKLNDWYLKGLKPRDIFKEINENGVSVAEKHVVAKVAGNVVTFVEPIRADIDPVVEWTVYDYPMIEGWGVEDLHFTGNCPVPFVHHKDFIHDSGFQGIGMKQGRNCWIRRCRFTDMTQAFLASGCIASSFIMNTIEGHQGHGNFSMNWGGGNLIGLCQDLTDKGSFHGCGISHENVGGVIWRYESVGATKQTPRCGGPDFHAQFPYCSLWDISVANLRDNGGSYVLQPNHLRDLTFWNFEQIGEKIHHDYWNMPKTEEDAKNKYFGKTKVAYPNYIGFHGVMSTFNREHLGLFESYGAPVEPASLFEAQLAKRLGGAPAWVAEAKAEWERVKATHRAAATPSRLWTQFREAKQTGGEPELADFSFAGYRHGEEPLPTVEAKVFDVTRSGAVPNDGKSDKKAILLAIEAAEKQGSGIVFFPPGRFLINEPTDPVNQPIRIGGSGIVLRGSGSGEGGTELFMNLHLDPTDPKKLYSCPFMIEFKGKGESKTKTAVVADARRETFSVQVKDAAAFKAGDWVLLNLENNSPQLVAEAVAPYTPDPAWKKINGQGVVIDEFHLIQNIDGNTLVFKEPIHTEVIAAQGWMVINYEPLEEVGVEGIAFRGNWHGDFVHHRSFQDDSGWSGVAFSKTVNGWIRNCRFTDWSRAVSIKACAATTVQDLVLDGNAGHNAISVHNSSHVLVRDVEDTSGHWHASGVAGKCSGNVFLNCEYRADTCFESHASQPRWTLFDNISGGWKYGRWGGALGSLPNHLRGLVLWNYNNTGEGEPGEYGFIRPESVHGRIIMPYVIGFHGNPQAFDESQVEVLESNGARVWPDSLYEAQFELRMKKGSK